MRPGATEISIPSDVVQKWQRTVDLLASIVQVPAAVVCKLEPPHYSHYKVVASSRSEGNPFPVDDTFAMDIGTFCETVIKSRDRLLVVNGRDDAVWNQAPEMQVGMVSYLGFPVFWPDGRVCGTICFLDNKANEYSERYEELLVHCRDVLQADLQTLVRFGDEIEYQKAHLSELFSRVPNAVAMIDREFRVVRVNPAFTRILGYTAEESIGRNIHELTATGDAEDEAERAMGRMFESEVPLALEIIRLRSDGSRVSLSATCVPVPSTHGGHVGYLIYRDLTEAKQFEAEQRRYQGIELELARANRIAMLGQLSASIAHELNQPLTGIITNSSTCLRMLTGETQDLLGAQDAAQRTMRDAHRASEVIARLRALFSNREPSFEAVDLNEATREVIALSLGDLQSNVVELRTQFADSLPHISADRIQLQQVVLNLIRNALDAMSTVNDRNRDLVVTTETLDNGMVRLSVKDAGLGFDPATMNRLFDVFYSTKSTGMGVGLAVSRSIIESHDGHLWATLNDGPGATFWFSVPMRRKHQQVS